MKNRKNMKRLLGMLVLSMIATFFAGCGQQNSAISSKNRLEEIRAKGYIEVATDPYFAPMGFIDPTKEGNDKYVGSDIEFAKYIANKLGVELRLVPLEFTAVLGSITEGKYDLAVSALAYKPDRAEAMILSDGYYFSDQTAGYGLMIREKDRDVIKNPENLKDKVVVAQSGSLQEMFVNEQIPKYKEFKKVSATTDGFLMVQENKADACVVDKSMGQLYIDANKGSGLMIVEEYKFYVDESTSGTRVGIPKGEDELASEINKIIEEVVNSGIYEQWYKDAKEVAKTLGL